MKSIHIKNKCKMLSDIQLFLLFTIPLLLWFYPVLKWSRVNWKLLVGHIITQILYSIFSIWMINHNPGKGYMSIWLFYWFYIAVIHLLGFNVWTYLKIKRINNAD